MEFEKLLGVERKQEQLNVYKFVLPETRNQKKRMDI
jgi:hypothetical protein